MRASRASRRSSSCTLSRSSGVSSMVGKSVLDLMSRSVEATKINCDVSPSGNSGSFSMYARYVSHTSARLTSEMESLRSSMRSRSASRGPSNCAALMLKELFIFGFEFRGLRETRVDASHVAWECRCFFHVDNFKHAGGNALEASRRAPVRRQTVFECLQIEGEFCGVKTAFLHARDQHIVIVYTLGAAVDLEPAKKKIEPTRIRRFRRILIRIESTFFGGISGNKYEIRPVPLLCPHAQSALMLGVEIGGFGQSQSFKGLLERQDRNFIGYQWYRCLESLEDICVLFCNGIHGFSVSILQNAHRFP